MKTVLTYTEDLISVLFGVAAFIVAYALLFADGENFGMVQIISLLAVYAFGIYASVSKATSVVVKRFKQIKQK